MQAHVTSDGVDVPSSPRAPVPSPAPGIPEKCFKALMARYRVSPAFLDLGPGTRAEYARHMRYVEPAIGLSPVAAFTADHMDQIMSRYPDTPELRQAIRRTMSALLSYAARTLKWIPANPLIRTDNPRKRQEEGQKPYTEPEIARFRERHPYGTRERLVYEIGLATAFRREDIARVPGEDILAGLIPLLTNKAGVLVVAPVTRHLRNAYIAFRKAHPATAGCRYAIGAQESGEPIHKRTVSKFMEAAFKAAGCADGQARAEAIARAAFSTKRASGPSGRFRNFRFSCCMTASSLGSAALRRVKPARRSGRRRISGAAAARAGRRSSSPVPAKDGRARW